MNTRREYQLGSSIAGYGVDDPDSILSESFFCKSARNRQGYCDEEVDRLIAQQSYDYFAHWPHVKTLVPHHWSWPTSGPRRSRSIARQPCDNSCTSAP